MGQYYFVVNLTKREYINAWDLGGVAKFSEWLLNRQTGVIIWLLRKSDDYERDYFKDYKYLGRWAGDRIVLIGDYDSSNLVDELYKSYKNISVDLVMEIDDYLHNTWKLCYEDVFAYEGFFKDLEEEKKLARLAQYSDAHSKRPNAHSKK